MKSGIVSMNLLRGECPSVLSVTALDNRDSDENGILQVAFDVFEQPVIYMDTDDMEEEEQVRKPLLRSKPLAELTPSEDAVSLVTGRLSLGMMTQIQIIFQLLHNSSIMTQL